MSLSKRYYFNQQKNYKRRILTLRLYNFADHKNPFNYKEK